MPSLRYRCVALQPLGAGLDDMASPVQVHFEPVGEDLVARLNRYGMFAPILPAREAREFSPGREYDFVVQPAPAPQGRAGTVSLGGQGAA